MELIITLLIFIPILIISVVVHEVSHGKVAEMLGDPTAKNMGRLTLNPIKHIDPFGSILLPAIMYAVAGFAIGYAKPVPIDPRYFKNPQKGMALTAVAGPLSNFSMAVVAGLFLKLHIFSTSGFIGGLLFLFVMLNVLLGAFNLLPMPPLDGSKIVAGFLPKSSLYAYYKYEKYGMVVLFVLLIFFPQVLTFMAQKIILPLTQYFV
jgi:Zn-dependent protease